MVKRIVGRPGIFSCQGEKGARHFFRRYGRNFGSLFIEADGTWRIIAPTEPGPQPYNPGGDMVLWTSQDQGKTWTKVKQLTHNSRYNHTYARRPVHAHPDFYALWADGDCRQPSESRLYFTSKTGDKVWRLPPLMTTDLARPEEVK